MSNEQPEELEAHCIRVRFGGVTALDGVDFALRPKEIIGLIGPNGSGKTTLVNVLSGFQRPTAGRVRLHGRDVTRCSPARLAKYGLARTFQELRLFERLTVLENVEAPAVSVGLRRGHATKQAWRLLEVMNLTDRASEQATSLAYGFEKRLAIARALSTKPRFLLLDEPAAGLNERESDQLLPVIRLIRDEFLCGILVIEHDMRLIMQLCERIQVIDHGKTISSGPPTAVRADRKVIEAYLGTWTHTPKNASD